MPSISTCPRCSRMVAIPSGLDAAALVRCPLCDAEYPLNEAIEMELVPPDLIPVDAAESPLDAEVLNMITNKDDAEQTAPHPVEPLTFRRPAQRKSKNALRIFVEIVLGGVVGISVGYVVLAWMAWIMGSRFDLPPPPKVLKPVLQFVLPDRIWTEKEQPRKTP